jgi:hypothetical protein
MKTVALRVSARRASFCSEVLAGRTPRERRETRERGRRRSYVGEGCRISAVIFLGIDDRL